MVESGGQYVMTDGAEVKLRWCVECWDIAGNELIVLVCVGGGGSILFYKWPELTVNCFVV